MIESLNSNISNKKIFIAGGGGYVGAELSKILANLGCKVTVYDLFIYGEDVIPNHKNIQKIKGDIRDKILLKEAMLNHSDLIHLACISNDPSFELDPQLGKSINLDSFRPFVEIALHSKIKTFVYASSSSVYGIKEEQNVTEDMSLEPLTDYSLFKSECEKILFEYSSDEFVTTVIRPATVCGYSSRQRLDVIVNILTNHAYNNNKIKIFGGSQLRPNIHIKDMINCYLTVLNSKNIFKNKKIYNAGYQNQSVSDIANIVKNSFNKKIELETVETDDNRSYHISSQKIKKELGFEAKYNIKNAVEDLIFAFDNGLLPNSMNDKKYFNIKTMQEYKLD